MAKIAGTWELMPKRTINYDGFAKASGIPNDLVEKYRNDVQTIEYIINGEEWKIGYTASGKTQWNSGKFGTEVSGTDEDTGEYKVIVTKDSDSSITEVSRSAIMDWKPFTTTRTIEPNGEMKAVVEIKDEKSGNMETATQFFKNSKSNL